jgi:hypothetical protein
VGNCDVWRGRRPRRNGFDAHLMEATDALVSVTRNGSGDRCTWSQPISHTQSHSGSIYGVGGRLQSFRISDLELVDQNSVSWNPMMCWLRSVEAPRRAA